MNKKPSAQQIAKTMQKQGKEDILSDILGSYTGTAKDNEPPEQDADDL